MREAWPVLWARPKAGGQGQRKDEVLEERELLSGEEAPGDA